MSNIKRLILGSAGRKEPGTVTVDIDPKRHPDVVHDLNRAPYPFKNGEFDEIVCHHVLEHLLDIDPAMVELHRICAVNGKINIEVSHHTSWMANIPQHKLRFNYFAFDGYLAGQHTWQTGGKIQGDID